MADYATFAAAYDHAKSLMADNTYTVAYASRSMTTGKISVQVLQKMSDGGGWTEIVVAP